MRTSYSAIGTYLQCPQKYKFQVIDRLRVPKSREAIFGTLVHSTLHYMFQRDPLFPTLEEVIAHFRENWPSRETFNQEASHDPLKQPWSEQEEKIYFEEGVRMLKKFYEKNAPWNYTVLDLESRFEIVITDEKTGASHILAGIIDRIDKTPEGAYEIIDYKTSKRMPSQDVLDKNLQLSLYALGLQKRWPHLKPEEIKLSLYFLKHGEKLSTVPNAEIIEKTKQHILKTIAEIEERTKSGKPFEPMPSPLCNWCGFKPLCPAWRHLYKKQGEKEQPDIDIDQALQEYFRVRQENKDKESRLSELQSSIKAYMAEKGLTRVFSEAGTISKKMVQRYAYDLIKVKTLLSPLGKWEEILKADEIKLRRVMKEIPEEIRNEIAQARSLQKEYEVLTPSTKRVEKPIMQADGIADETSETE